ncbi:MAG: hypothetical protein FKY71_10810 [Spiribacter salinus]|uniref:Uncharacterized protein n=1 Tax=Spiribacter salinus TaxID=1335746 RepID=A0A540VQH7_9GAMM|nr:MAG: hypothetical protein FKY71_10810 [Spiribacter salinus]
MGSADGFGNPNNTNTGFVQLFDTDGSSVDSLSFGGKADFTKFTMAASGTDAGASEIARLWPAPTEGNAASISAGRLLEYAFDLTAIFATPHGDNTRTGETPQDASGSFTGIFENTGSNEDLNNFYSFDFTLQSGSSAADNDYVAQFRDGSDFASTAARTFEIPAPATPLLLVAGLAGLGLAGKGRRGASAE